MTAYRTKPEVVDAFKWDGNTVSDRPAWLFEALLKSPNSLGAIERTEEGLRVECPAGPIMATAGCWVMQKPDGTLMVDDDASFTAEFEPVPTEPVASAAAPSDQPA